MKISKAVFKVLDRSIPVLEDATQEEIINQCKQTNGTYKQKYQYTVTYLQLNPILTTNDGFSCFTTH